MEGPPEERRGVLGPVFIPSRTGRPMKTRKAGVEPTASIKERAKALSKVRAGHMTQVEAAAVLGLTDRQVRRLIVRFRKEGLAGLRHRSVGRPGNRRCPDEIRQEVLRLADELRPDSVPTSLAKRLEDRLGLKVNPQTIRNWLLAAGKLSKR
jgi:transposase